MKKIQDNMLQGKEIIVGLEDSKKSWKMRVRSGRLAKHGTSMSVEYEKLLNCFRNRSPECKIRVMYEPGFRGFKLCDPLVADGWECFVTPGLR